MTEPGLAGVGSISGGNAGLPGVLGKPDASPESATQLAPVRVAGAAAAPGPTAQPRELSKAETDANTLAYYARLQAASLKDPVQRAAILNDHRTNLRRQFAQLREKLKLSDATFEQLVNLLAEQNLESQDQWVRCAVDPKCNAEEEYRRNPPDDHSQELLALLGSDKLDEFRRYRDTISERDAVVTLRGRLTDANPLRDEQAESLAVALADERVQYQKEATARGQKLSGMGGNLGMIFYSDDASSPEQRLVDATQYSQRLRQRAASVLTPAQLAAYNQMQDELLAQIASVLRPLSASHG